MATVSTNTAAFFSGAVSARRPGLLKTVKNMIELRNERRALAGLDAEALADIGVSAKAAAAEASRHAWDAPDHWHK